MGIPWNIWKHLIDGFSTTQETFMSNDREINESERMKDCSRGTEMYTCQGEKFRLEFSPD